MALSHAELAAKLLQGEICAHSRTYLVGRYFQNETLRRPDTVQEKGKRLLAIVQENLWANKLESVVGT